MDSSTLEQYDPLISKLKDGVTVSDALKLYHTHLLRASTELGHYYSTFRHKSGVNSNLDYYYNNVKQEDDKNLKVIKNMIERNAKIKVEIL